MTEEVKSAAPEAAAVQTPSIEDTARAQGWKPKEEYDGDTSKWVSAETFVAKGELISKIETLNKELKTQRKATQMLQEHHKRVQESEFKRAVEFLKAQKKAAYERGDVDAIMDLDEQIATVRETQRIQKAEPANDDKPDVSEFNSWVEQNGWYDSDKEMRDAADTIGVGYKGKNPDKTPGEVLSYVEKQIKRMFPEKFQNPKRNQPSAVEGSGRSAGSGGKRDSFELSEEERKVMNTFVRQGIMSADDYISEVKRMRG